MYNNKSAVNLHKQATPWNDLLRRETPNYTCTLVCRHEGHNGSNKEISSRDKLMQHMKLQTSTYTERHLEGGIVTPLVKKFTASYGTSRFIIASTGSRQWFLSWARWTQPTSSDSDQDKVLRDLPSYDSVVGIATGYGLDDRGIGVRVPVGARIFSSPCRPDRLWGPPSLLFPGGKAAGAWSWPLTSN
jgi:hypothetical protein